MKCVHLWSDVSTEGLMLGKAGQIVRIDNDLARDLVAEGDADYVSKSAWKRDLLRGDDHVQYIYNPNIVGEFKATRTAEMYSGRDGLIIADYNAAGDLCGVEVIGDVEQAEIDKITNW